MKWPKRVIWELNVAEEDEVGAGAADTGEA